jgi:hypothetical protein
MIDEGHWWDQFGNHHWPWETPGPGIIRRPPLQVQQPPAPQPQVSVPRPRPRPTEPRTRWRVLLARATVVALIIWDVAWAIAGIGYVQDSHQSSHTIRLMSALIWVGFWLIVTLFALGSELRAERVDRELRRGMLGGF